MFQKSPFLGCFPLKKEAFPGIFIVTVAYTEKQRAAFWAGLFDYYQRCRFNGDIVSRRVKVKVTMLRRGGEFRAHVQRVEGEIQGAVWAARIYILSLGAHRACDITHSLGERRAFILSLG
jgi:hypothetical protein